MKKQLLSVTILSFLFSFSKAQNVGIGTTAPNASAQLDITATDKGLLIPRVNLVNLTNPAPVISPAYGLVVFNNNGALPGGFGLYYWAGGFWLKLQTVDGSWNTSGNSFLAGENPLLGSINNKPLRFIVNNISSGFMDSSNTHFGFKAGMQRTTAKNTVAIGNAALFVNTTIGGLVAIGDSALYNNGAGAVNQYEGEANTAVGFASLQKNTIGGDNTAVGFETLKNNVNGSSNTAVGTLAMKYVTGASSNTALGSYALGALVTGDANTAVGSFALGFNKNAYNTAVGYQSLLFNSADVSQGHLAVNNNAFGSQTLYNNRTGGRNVGIGDEALYTNRNGNNNVALGSWSGYRNTGSGNIFIGTNAGQNARSDNKLYIENSLADSNNALIYGDFFADSLKLNAKVIVRDRLHVTDAVHVEDSNVVAYAGGQALTAALAGAPPISGPGRRMMWYVDKGAFRAGYAGTVSWDKDSVGNYSYAGGFNTVASGLGATAFGVNTSAGRDLSFAVGNTTKARGWSSVAMGVSTVASSGAETVVGSFNTLYTPVNVNFMNPADRAFVVGIGLADGNRKDGLVVLKNGNTGFGTSTPAARLHVLDSSVVFSSDIAALASPGDAPVSGKGKRLMWYSDKASFRVGYVTSDQWDSDSIGIYSFASGHSTVASSGYTVAMGAAAKARGSNSMALGSNITAVSANEFVIGRYNTDYTPASAELWSPTDRLFVIGNGIATNAKSDALIVYKNAAIEIGGYVNNYLRIGLNASGLDYAGLMLGHGVAGKQADAGKIQYGGFGGNTHWLNIVGGGTNAGGNDRVIKLWSEGGMRIRGNTLPDFDNTYSLGQSGSRWSSVWAVNGIIQTSDARLKINIVPLYYGLNEVMQMKPVQYNWKETPDGNKEIGFLAQDIQQLIPEAVVAPANGDALGMKYTELIPVLVNAIQEQQKQIDELKRLLKEKNL